MQINRISSAPIQKRQAPSANFKGWTAVHVTEPKIEKAADKKRPKAYYKIMKQVGNLVKKAKGSIHTTVHSPDASIHHDTLIHFPEGTEALERSVVVLLKRFQGFHPQNVTVTENADTAEGLGSVFQKMLDEIRGEN